MSKHKKAPAVPTTETPNKLTPLNITFDSTEPAPLQPHTPRLWRTLELLATGREFSHLVLTRQCGQLNAPDLIYQLRHKLGWNIHCRRIKVSDRDGNVTKPGLWSLDEAHIPIATQMLAERAGGAE